MKFGTIITLVILSFFIAVLIPFLTQSAIEQRCHYSCYNPDVTCDHNDNNCIGGAHYCGDMCYGGISQPVWIQLSQDYKHTPGIFGALLVVILFFMIRDEVRNKK